MSDAEFSGAASAQAQPQPPASEPSGSDLEARIADLEARLAAASAEAGKLHEDWLRAKADTENVRRRGAEEVAKAHKFGVEAFAAALLAVKDSMDAALNVENTSVEAFKEGVELTARQLDSAFEKFGVTSLNPQGEKFDPHRHQAIGQVESDQEPNTVVSVLQKGYMLHDRVLRPALVMVSKAREAPAG